MGTLTVKKPKDNMNTVATDFMSSSFIAKVVNWQQTTA